MQPRHQEKKAHAGVRRNDFAVTSDMPTDNNHPGVYATPVALLTDRWSRRWDGSTPLSYPHRLFQPTQTRTSQ